MPEPAAKTDRARLTRPSCSNVVVCLALGAATTVVLAWAISLIVYPQWVQGGPPRQAPLFARSEADEALLAEQSGEAVRVKPELDWPIRPPPDFFPAAPNCGVEVRSLGVRGAAAWEDNWHPWLPYAEAGWIRMGIPVPALGQEYAHGGLPRTRDLGVMRTGVLVHRDFFRLELRLPILIHWPGFIIDTLFWGAAWLGVIAAFRSLRARRRRKRGLCAHCKYELAGLGLCPECGTPSS